MSADPDEIPPCPATVPAHSWERIISAAADLGTLVGVKLVSVGDIALRADVSEDLVISQWSSVSELMTAVVTRDLQNQISDIEAEVRRADGMDGQIVEAFTGIFWFLDGHPLIGGTLRSSPDLIAPSAPHSVHAAIAMATRMFVDIAASVVLEHAGESVDVVALDELIIRLVESLLLVPTRALTALTRSDTDAYARRCVLPLIRAFRAPFAGGAT